MEQIKELLKKLLADVPMAIFSIMGDLFFLGRHFKKEGDTSAYKSFEDEAKWGAASEDLYQKFVGEDAMDPAEAQAALAKMDSFFARHPRYSKTVRYALARIVDREHRREWVLRFVRANSDQELRDMCEHLEDKHAIADFILNKFVDGPTRWRETRRTLRPTENNQLGQFLKKLEPVHRFQFEAGIGSIWDLDERLKITRRVLKHHPNQAAMKKEAINLLIIKESGVITKAWQAGKWIWEMAESLYSSEAFSFLDNPAGNAAAATARANQTAALRDETENLLLGRAIRAFGRFTS